MLHDLEMYVLELGVPSDKNDNLHLFYSESPQSPGRTPVVLTLEGQREDDEENKGERGGHLEAGRLDGIVGLWGGPRGKGVSGDFCPRETVALDRL